MLGKDEGMTHIIKIEKDVREVLEQHKLDVTVLKVPHISEVEKRKIQLEIIQQGRRRPSSGK